MCVEISHLVNVAKHACDQCSIFTIILLWLQASIGVTRSYSSRPFLCALAIIQLLIFHSQCWPRAAISHITDQVFPTYPVKIVYNQDVASIEQLIKDTNCTSPCPLPHTFLLALLETNPCPTLYPTYPLFSETIKGSRYCTSSEACPVFCQKAERCPEIEASEMVSDSAEVWGL